MRYRQYEPEPLEGTPVPFSTVKQRKALVGRRIQWHETDWHRRREGVVGWIKGKNVLVDGNWEWAPNMQNVHVVTP